MRAAAATSAITGNGMTAREYVMQSVRLMFVAAIEDDEEQRAGDQYLRVTLGRRDRGWLVR